MKRLLPTLLLCISTLITAQTVPQGTLVKDSLYAKSLENQMGESAKRSVTVYLPPGYSKSIKHYPVIYFLHGFLNDDGQMQYIKDLVDYAIDAQKTAPFIMVIPDQRTTYDGSFYSNSALFGKWEDFTVFDLVAYMDSHYRTLPKKESRGIAGHSMGGYGALKLAMKHPDVFSTVYALSPGALAIVREYGPNSDTYLQFARAKTLEELSASYFGKVIMAFGRSWSANSNNAPFYCDVPFSYTEEGILQVNHETLLKWHQNMPFYMIADYADNLRQLKAIKFDWGRNAGDRFTIQCKMFSQGLENAGIMHFAEEYIGTHTNNIYSREGRLPQQMLPFFDYYLSFE